MQVMITLITLPLLTNRKFRMNPSTSLLPRVPRKRRKRVCPSCLTNFGTPFLRKFVRSFVTIGLQTLVPMGITNTVDAVEPPITPMDNNASTSMTKTTRIMILTLFMMLEKAMGRKSFVRHTIRHIILCCPLITYQGTRHATYGKCTFRQCYSPTHG